VAEQERKTNAERRAEARAERKRVEEEAARRAKKQSMRNAGISIAVVAVLALVLVPTVMALFGGDEAETTISQAAALEARSSAGCVMEVDNEPLPDAGHHEPATAPPADVLYAASPVRPTASGPHFGSIHPAIGGVPSDALDERATTHNLEHGAVIAWFDPEAVDGSTVDAMEDWMIARQDMGFDIPRSGGSVFVSPFTSMTGDKPIALRAWGFALNCDSWDPVVADSFLIDYWGTHGRAPERNFSPYPAEALGYDIDGSDDATDGATDGASDDQPATDEPTADDADGTDAPSDVATTEG
jgi:hypothetical protein